MVRATTWLLQKGCWFQVDPHDAGVGWTLSLYRIDNLQRPLMEHLGLIKKVGSRQWQVVLSRLAKTTIGFVHNVEASNPQQAITNALEDKSTIVGMVGGNIDLDDYEVDWDSTDGHAVCYDVDNNNELIEAEVDEHGFWHHRYAESSS
jgi:hypothetical protein